MSTGFFDCEVECARLRAELAAMTAERDHWKAMNHDRYWEQVKKLDAAQAREAKLREVLGIWDRFAQSTLEFAYSKLAVETTEALDLPNDDSALQERLAAERERCAKVCEELGMIGHWHYTAAIRSMK